jgi:hypothetical protein
MIDVVQCFRESYRGDFPHRLYRSDCTRRAAFFRTDKEMSPKNCLRPPKSVLCVAREHLGRYSRDFKNFSVKFELSILGNCPPMRRRLKLPSSAVVFRSFLIAIFVNLLIYFAPEAFIRFAWFCFCHLFVCVGSSDEETVGDDDVCVRQTVKCNRECLEGEL